MKTLKLDFPDELLELFSSEEEIKKEAKEALVLDLVRRGKISKGKAAELLGINLWDLPALLSQYDIPWFNYPPEALKRDLEGLKNISNKGA